jgi:predicted nucleic acid-binding Zn ribbon protein
LKYLILAAIIGLLLALLIRRLLPYLRMAQGFLNAIRQVRSGATGTGSPLSRKPDTQKKLVRCSVCGTWIPSARALAGGASTRVICSERCSRDLAAKRRRRAAI